MDDPVFDGEEVTDEARAAASAPAEPVEGAEDLPAGVRDGTIDDEAPPIEG